MPSHIYSMVGLWEESIASNRSALEVQRDYYHATDFMVYAHLQLAQDAKAKALVDQSTPTVVSAQREFPILGELHGARRDSRALRARARRLEGAAALPVVSDQDAPWPIP